MDGLPSYDDLQYTPERVARFSQGEQPDENISLDYTMQVVEVYECYIKIDVNGDGIAELRKIVYSGNEILDDEECDLFRSTVSALSRFRISSLVSRWQTEQWTSS